MKPEDATNVYYLRERQISARRKAVLQRVVRDHQPAIRRFLRARLASHPDYEDLVQEIYVKLARLDDLEAKLSVDEAQVRSYLISMANNLVRDRFRRETVRREMTKSLAAEMVIESLSPSPEHILASRQHLAAIMKAILRLPAKTRRAFLLNRFRDLSYREIADEMNISISMVEKHIMRALAAVRSCFQG